MENPWVKEAERIGDENSMFSEWVDCNEELLLEIYQNSEPEMPETLLVDVLDDDFPDIYDFWVSNLEFKDIPEDFINDEYNSYCEGEEDE